MYMNTCTCVCVPRAHGSQKNVLTLLELELGMVLSNCIGAGNGTQVLVGSYFNMSFFTLNSGFLRKSC